MPSATRPGDAPHRRRTRTTGLLACVALLVSCGGDDLDGGAAATASPSTPADVTALPSPATSNGAGLEDVLASRRSVREFADDELTAAELGQLLWAAQGITSDEGGRTAPSAGALYPLEVHAVTASGHQHYLPTDHRVATVSHEDLRTELADAAAGQDWVADAPAVLVVVGVESRTADKYGDRAGRYVLLEAGHAAQNVLLQATAWELAATPVGAFDDATVVDLLALPDGHVPLVLIPVGHARG